MSPAEKAELAGAVLEAARMEAESVLRRKKGSQEMFLTYSTLKLVKKDLELLRSRMTELLADMSERQSKRGRRARLIFAAYLLDD